MSEDIVETLLNMMTEEQKAELINKLSKTNGPKKELRDVKKKQQKTQARSPDVYEDFTMKKGESKQRSTQIEVKKRENLFIDDGTEHQNELNKTPEIVPAVRSRPKFKKVEQTCNYCKKSEMVHPQFVREFYTCVSCASGGASR